jgi:hypothetical protein
MTKQSPVAEGPLVALISATPIAIPPAVDGMRDEFPQALVWNILDDRLLVEANRHGGLTPDLHGRMARLIEHAKAEGARGILLTCSMYGPVAHDASDAAVPVLASDDAAFAAVIGSGFRSVLILSSLEPALADARSRFQEAARAAGADIRVIGVVPDGALAAATAGDTAALVESLAAAGKPFVGEVDAVLLAQYSLSPVAEELTAALGVPVFSGPKSAAALLRSRLLEDATSW